MLQFLKKHYEKVILTLLLIIFIFLLILQIKIMLQASSIGPDSLKLQSMVPNWKRINIKDAKYDIAGLVTGTDSKWVPSKARSPESTVFTDLCTPIDLAQCPHCKRLILASDFPPVNSEKVGVCGYCGAKLLPPVVKIVIHDADKDGIPDEVEAANGLNPNDPSDALLDLDNDGFSNLEEFRSGTDMKDPKSRPASFAKKLQVVDIVKRALPMKLTKIITRGDDKAKWEIHMNVQDGGRLRTRFYSLGDIVKCDEGEFKIVDIISETKTIIDKSVNAPMQVNISRLVMKPLNSEDKIVAEIGQTIMEPREKITLLDTMFNKEMNVSVGDSFTLGTESTGTEKYTVESCNVAQKTVNLKREDGQAFEVKPAPAEKTDVPTSPFIMPSGLPPGGTVFPLGEGSPPLP